LSPFSASSSILGRAFFSVVRSIPFVNAFLAVDGKAISTRIAASVKPLVQFPLFTTVTPLFRARYFAVHPIKERKSLKTKQKGDSFESPLLMPSNFEDTPWEDCGQTSPWENRLAESTGVEPGRLPCYTFPRRIY
jgi:hypothetical protein